VSGSVNNGNLTVPTAEGPVTGVCQGATAAWNGVPYATPPVGELRFRRPQPAACRDEPLETTTWGPSPMQPAQPETNGGVGDNGVTDEDCLTLNIVRPAGGATDLPVMVWIYGGAFTVGASRNYDGRHLAARGDVIVVTVNYRVGSWGFLDLSSLTTPEHVFESNIGLHDQIAGLRWVRDNIAAFGGDADNVTLFGESAGGSSVLSLMCMPEARGLFHRVIAESPAVAGTPAKVHAQDARRLAGIVAGEDATPAEAAAALVDCSADELLAASLRLTAETAKTDPGRLIYGPTVDDESLPVALLPGFLSGRQARVPLVIGTNASEGALFLVGAQQSGAELLPVLPDTVRRTMGVSAAADGVVAAYPGFDDPQVSAQVGGDMVFWYPSTVFADAHAAVAPTRMYRFDHVSADPRFGGPGAAHGAEIPFVFGRVAAVLQAEGASADDRDVVFAGRIMDRWLAFARDGEPGEGWPHYSAAQREVLVLDGRSDGGTRVEADPQSERREAWAALFS
jgi:para-nitrobenzyl esterase